MTNLDEKVTSFQSPALTLIREEETKYVLDNYQTMTPQYILDYFLQHRNDSDCIYIFNNLPQNLIDDLAAKEVKLKDKFIEEMDQKIDENNNKIKQLDAFIETATKFNKQLCNDIYQQECQMEAVRELNRQLGIY